MTAAASPRRSISSVVGDVTALALALAWLVTLAHVLRHRIFVTHDSIITYAHVWYVSDRLWRHHRIPMAMPIVGHGKGFAFPYGFPPWLVAATIRPLFGDWTVTLLFVVGTCALVATTFVAFPELRRGWWAAGVLANPALFAAPLLGQFPFLWAAVMLLGAVAAWRHGRRGWATLLLAGAQVTHPAVMMPLALVLVVGWLRFEERRRNLLRRYALATLVSLPAAVLVLRSPVFVESSTFVKVWNFVDTVGPRSLIIVVPVVLTVVARRRPRPSVAFASLVVVLAIDVLGWGPLGMPRSWATLDRAPNQQLLPFLTSPEFHPGDTYRLLHLGDKRIGLYQLIRAGGRTDAEFFPESTLQQSWPSLVAYSRMLRTRRVDHVMLWSNYTRIARTNERALLDRLEARPPLRCDGPLVCVHLDSKTPEYRLYTVSRHGPGGRSG